MAPGLPQLYVTSFWDALSSFIFALFSLPKPDFPTAGAPGNFADPALHATLPMQSGSLTSQPGEAGQFYVFAPPPIVESEKTFQSTPEASHCYPASQYHHTLPQLSHLLQAALLFYREQIITSTKALSTNENLGCM